MRELHAARRGHYAACADVSFATDRVSVEQIVGAIVDALR
jgi:shikimate kinase